MHGSKSFILYTFRSSKRHWSNRRWQPSVYQLPFHNPNGKKLLAPCHNYCPLAINTDHHSGDSLIKKLI